MVSEWGMGEQTGPVVYDLSDGSPSLGQQLIEPIRRAQNNHRRYTQEDVDWIGLLIRLRESGMPLAQMVLISNWLITW